MHGQFVKLGTMGRLDPEGSREHLRRQLVDPQRELNFSLLAGPRRSIAHPSPDCERWPRVVRDRRLRVGKRHEGQWAMDCASGPASW